MNEKILTFEFEELKEAGKILRTIYNKSLKSSFTKYKTQKAHMNSKEYKLLKPLDKVRALLDEISIEDYPDRIPINTSLYYWKD